jgi:hypothetical protein
LNLGISQPQLPDEAAKQLGKANLMYATGQYKEAVEVLMHVIKVRGRGYKKGALL